MTCGPDLTHSFLSVGALANGSMLLTPPSPCSMYPIPTSFSTGFFLLTRAWPHVANSSLRHIGSFPEEPTACGVEAKQVQPLVPFRISLGWPPLSDHSMMAAPWLMEAGAALMASWTLSPPGAATWSAGGAGFGAVVSGAASAVVWDLGAELQARTANVTKAHGRRNSIPDSWQVTLPMYRHEL